MPSKRQLTTLQPDRLDSFVNQTDAVHAPHRDRVQISFRVPKKIREEFKIMAARQNVDMTELIIELLTQALTKREQP